MHIIQIVPRLPPAIDGVGDYAYLLAQQLRAAHNIQTMFIVCDPLWENSEILKTETRKSEVRSQRTEDTGQRTEVGDQMSGFRPPVSLDGFPIYQLKERTAAELLKVLSQPGMPTTVLLQYVGYGYQQRGCPVWLASALRAWKSEVRSQKSEPASDLRSLTSGRRLATMFHELYAQGPIWRSEFWVSPVQKWVVKSLARLSDHGFTNLTICSRTLQRLTSRNETDFTVLPVFSNLGEPEVLPPWNERKPRMIVFGSASWRRQVYVEHKAELESACRSLGLNEIVDIGTPIEIPQLAMPVRECGILPAKEASRELLAARAGFFAYPVNCLGKSGIFAAYAAHGLAPVTFDKNQLSNEDGLISGEHFISTSALSESDATRGEKIQMANFKWYGEHTITSQAKKIQKLIQAQEQVLS